MAGTKPMYLSEAEARSAINRIERDGTIVFRGVRIDGPLLGRIWKAVPRQDGKPVLKNVQFDGAWFEADVGMDGARFEGEVSFRNATFEQAARFERAEFLGPTDFIAVTFAGSASFSGATFAQRTRFDQAKLLGAAGFGRAAFEGATSFAHARFSSAASFRRATFVDEATFQAARFRRGARFRETKFAGWASFSRTHFDAEVGFREASFAKAVQFERATFEGTASFHGASFARAARFRSATFRQDVSFDGAQFADDLSLENATFHSDALFTDVRFEGVTRLGPAIAFGRVALDRSSFTDNVQISLSAGRLTCLKTRFRGGANIRLRWAQILLDEAQFEQPSIVAGSARFEGMKDQRLARTLARGPQLASARPVLLSLRGADVGNLVLGTLDLRACRFAGTHNLDQLRMEGDVEFATPPAGWRWSRRRTLAEEHSWRIEQTRKGRKWAGWDDAACGLPDWVGLAVPDKRDTLGAGEIASIYRALRKGREDNKDEPGSADFYYGEMEMRRQRASQGLGRAPGRVTRDRGERGILWMYWLISGYGLRASRALTALLFTVVVFAFVLYAWGFEQPESLASAFLFSTESTTSLLRGTDRPLTTLGETLWVALRLLGPVFFGLALLSLRGRIKR